MRVVWWNESSVNRRKVSVSILNHQLDERISCIVIDLAAASGWLGYGPGCIAKGA